MAEDDQDLLKATGEALYGERYKVPLGDDLGVKSETMKSFGSGRMVIPVGVWKELVAIVQKRVSKLLGLQHRLDRAMNDAAGTEPEDPLKAYRDRIASGEPIMHHIVQMPFKVTLSPANMAVFDSHMQVGNIEQAAIQRVTVAIPIKSLRMVLEAVEAGRGPIEVSGKKDS